MGVLGDNLLVAAHEVEDLAGLMFVERPSETTEANETTETTTFFQASGPQVGMVISSLHEVFVVGFVELAWFNLCWPWAAQPLASRRKDRIYYCTQLYQLLS